MPRIDVISTTISGSISDGKKVERIIPLFKDHGFEDVRLIEVDSHEEARKAANTSLTDGCRFPLSAGGSGTFRAVLEGCIESGVELSGIRLGFLRKGSADLIGKVLNMPDNIDEAIKVFAQSIANDSFLLADVLNARCKSTRESSRHFIGYGGAEIFGKKVRDIICPEKISGERWLEIIEQVHNAGLKSNATMLFGHVEKYEDRIDHLARLRELQDKTGGFQAFIPLAFQPDNTRVPGAKGVSGIDALRTLAISRIYLDNFQHIKAYWVMLGLKTAQVALSFGVNDIDGTVIEEKIGHDAGAESPQALSRDQLLNLIRVAGKNPIERDTLYNELKTY